MAVSCGTEDASNIPRQANAPRSGFCRCKEWTHSCVLKGGGYREALAGDLCPAAFQ